MFFSMWLACSGGGESESAERTWDGDFLIDEVVIDCDAFHWTYSVRTQGWGDEITVDVVDRGAVVWSEHHELPEIDYGDGWAQFELELDQISDAEDYQDSVSTWFPCESKTLVTYGFAAWRYDGEMQECVAWGMDPEGIFPDCASWGDNGHDSL